MNQGTASEESDLGAIAMGESKTNGRRKRELTPTYLYTLEW